jgi:hypothetical protein
MRIGQRVILKVRMLGNEPGALGFVFNEYPDFDGNGLGIQVIFENGEYDGFSAKEQEEFLRCGTIDWRYCHYGFINVVQVLNDYESGFWRFDA